MGRRSSRNIPTKPVIAIYCEGDSEKAYFEMLRRKYHGVNVHAVKLNIKSVGSLGFKLIESAISTNKNLSRKSTVDKTYVIFDRDSLTDSDLIKCSKLALKNNIEIMFSSINFEIWILLHFEFLTRQYSAKELNERLSE